MTSAAWYADTLERVLWTALQALAASLLVLDSATLTWQVVGAAAIASLLKAVIAVNLPWTADDSASTLPEHVDPPS